MRWLITGARGLLATHLRVELERGGEHVVACTRDELDVLDERAVGEALRHVRPDVVVQGAAFTQVDLAEREPERCEQLNHFAVAAIAAQCRASGARLVLPSTDFVFDGDRGDVDEGCMPGPCNHYGWTKLRGEEAATRLAPDSLIVRTQALVGAWGNHFLWRIAERALAGEPVRVIDDRWVRPTWVPELAAAIVAEVRRGTSGVIHVAGRGEATWYDFAALALAAAGIDHPIERVSSTAFGAAAPRPSRVLLRSRRVDIRMPDLDECIALWATARRAA